MPYTAPNRQVVTESRLEADTARSGTRVRAASDLILHDVQMPTLDGPGLVT
jgi:CheY-like chemotaxis protein